VQIIGKTKNSKAAFEIFGALAETERTASTCVVGAFVETSKASSGEYLTWLAYSLMVLSLVGLLAATHPATVCGAFWTISHALSSSRFKTRFARAEVPFTNLFVSWFHSRRAYPSFVLKPRAERVAIVGSSFRALFPTGAGLA